MVACRIATAAACPHAAAEAEHEVECRLRPDVVMRQRAAVLDLLAREDEALLVRRDTLHVQDLLLDALAHVRRLDVEGDGLVRKEFDEDLHRAWRHVGTSCRLAQTVEVLRWPMTVDRIVHLHDRSQPRGPRLLASITA